MFRVRKRFTFEAAHQLERAHSKACTDSIHGHSYVVEVFFISQCLNPDLMVVDFSLISEACRQIRDEWDHALILPKNLAREHHGIPSNKMVVFEANPTAEVMAHVIYKAMVKAHEQMNTSNGLRVEKVRVHETADGWAEYEERTSK